MDTFLEAVAAAGRRWHSRRDAQADRTTYGTGYDRVLQLARDIPARTPSAVAGDVIGAEILYAARPKWP
jgi:hypothetical protein